jgi:hypothetical protein
MNHSQIIYAIISLFFLLSASGCSNTKKTEDSFESVEDTADAVSEDMPAVDVNDISEKEQNDSISADEYQYQDENENNENVPDEISYEDIEVTCSENIYSEDFNDCGTCGWVIENSGDESGWNIIKTTKSDSISLYYGNEEFWNYDSADLPNSGTVRSQVFHLPKNTDIYLSFKLFIDVEKGIEDSLAYDNFFVIVETQEQEKYVVFGKMDAVLNLWNDVKLSLSGFAGKTIFLVFFFDSVDQLNNNGYGIVVDDISLTSSCKPVICGEDKDCFDKYPFTEDSCKEKTCISSLISTECSMENPCKIDTPCDKWECYIGRNICVPFSIPDCCEWDFQCKPDDKECTVEKCSDKKCTVINQCKSKIPYSENFNECSNFEQAGFKTLNESGGDATFWKLDNGFFEKEPFNSKHPRFFPDKNESADYEHKLISPVIENGDKKNLVLKFDYMLDVMNYSNTETSLNAYITNPELTKISSLFNITTILDDISAQKAEVEVTSALLNDMTEFRIIISVKGKTTGHIFDCHADNIEIIEKQ